MCWHTRRLRLSSAKYVLLSHSCAAGGPTLLQAKWALDASGVPYKQTPWPMSTSYLGELPLRWRLGRLTGRITAPILLPDQQACKGVV
jgi:hypothetical protein